MLTIRTEHNVWDPPQDSLIIIDGVTEEDYWKLSSEDLKIEYAGGCLYIHSPASLKHEMIFNFLYLYLNVRLQELNVGELLGSRVAIELPGGHRPEPDLVLLPRDTYSESDTVYKGVPIWVIEILSTGTKKNVDHDLVEKLSWYTDAKIPEIWYVNPDTYTVIRYCYNSPDQTYKREEFSKDSVSPKLFPMITIRLEWLRTRPKLSEIT